MRTTLTTACVAALLAAGAGSAVAAPGEPEARSDAAIHAQAMRAQGVHQMQLAKAPVQIARQPLIEGGFEWADAGIGAAFAAALLLSAAGVSAVRRHSPTRLR
ncbi:MAG TPA: hypothetical protein VH276_07640 [Solirubrobacteraceae bacterium]|nr:hypothetical protein [Solirubrobacteraceae bacterium]